LAAIRTVSRQAPRALHLLRSDRPHAPRDAAGDGALSRAFLELVARREAPETLRLYRPEDVVAFSGLDATRQGFGAAVAAARRQGFDAALRLAGGRAAVFVRESLAFAWTVPLADTRRGIHERFERLSQAVAGALRALGADARVGEVAGEYCPGEWSVNLAGRVKVMGVGQRVVRGAAHVGGVIVVRDAGRVGAVLAPVYAALGYDWDPRTVGSVDQELPRVTVEAVADALCRCLGEQQDLVPADPRLLEQARALAPRFASRHRLDAAAPAGAGEGKIVRERGAG